VCGVEKIPALFMLFVFGSRRVESRPAVHLISRILEPLQILILFARIECSRGCLGHHIPDLVEQFESCILLFENDNNLLVKTVLHLYIYLETYFFGMPGQFEKRTRLFQTFRGHGIHARNKLTL